MHPTKPATALTAIRYLPAPATTTGIRKGYFDHYGGAFRPTEDQVKTLLADGAVTIDCTNEEVSHADKTYGLLASGYTIGAVQGNRPAAATVEVSVTPRPMWRSIIPTRQRRTPSRRPRRAQRLPLVYNKTAKAWQVKVARRPSNIRSSVRRRFPNIPFPMMPTVLSRAARGGDAASPMHRAAKLPF